MSKMYHYESFGETLEEAEANGLNVDEFEDALWWSYGFGPEDPRPDSLQCEVMDALEALAVEYLRGIGWTVTGYDEAEAEGWT